MDKINYTIWQMFFVSIFTTIATVALGLLTNNIWAVLAMIAIFSLFFTVILTKGVKARLRILLLLILAIIVALIVTFFTVPKEEPKNDEQNDTKLAVQEDVDDTEESKEEENEEEDEEEQKVKIKTNKNKKVAYSNLTDKMSGTYSNLGEAPTFEMLSQGKTSTEGQQHMTFQSNSSESLQKENEALNDAIQQGETTKEIGGRYYNVKR